MERYGGLRASPKRAVLLLVLFKLISLSLAGPVGQLPETTLATTESSIREGSCSLAGVVYTEGDVFQGNNSCERCSCKGGNIQCAKQRCEPRPGCKALHRPDHCCPTYQCDCEHNGHVLANGEKLLDPDNPCRVCYCQGGEVVCRKIACFVRDDCVPRHVPGRCCPEYDNCPLTGVTTMPEVAPSMSVSSAANYSSSSSLPSLINKDIVKQEITIKEITPVSEIPVLTDVKIKEVLPSQLAVDYYYSTKSPLITREATTDKVFKNENEHENKTQTIPVFDNSNSTLSSTLTTKPKEEVKTEEDSYPIKISLSTQVPSNSPVLSSSLSSSESLISTHILSTKAPVVEEEDTSVFEHNPAFPPLPDDLSVLRNHDDEIVPEPSVDAEHASTAQEEVTIVTDETSHTKFSTKETSETTASMDQYSTEPSFELNVVSVAGTTQSQQLKESPMLNLRSAIPSEILNIPSSVLEENTSELNDLDLTTLVDITTTPSVELHARENLVQTSTNGLTGMEATPESDNDTSTIINFDQDTTNSQYLATTMENNKMFNYYGKQKSEFNIETGYAEEATPFYDSTSNILQTSNFPENTVNQQTENSFQTEISSLAVETSDQNPQETNDNITKLKPIILEEKNTENYLSNTITEKTPEKSTSESKSDVTMQEKEFGIETSTENFETKYFPEIEKSQTSENVKHYFDEVSPSVIIITSTLPFSTGISTVDKTSGNLTTYAVTNVEASILKSTTTSNNILSTASIKDPYSSSMSSVTTDSSPEFGSDIEVSTDNIELINVSSDASKNAHIIEQNTKQNSVLTDLINLVGDVASISDHTENPPFQSIVLNSGISDSEELIPVNAGYKSKNNNWSLNSITEIPIKTKTTQNKQKILEIEDYGSATISDLPPPHDKTEPTTRLPIIDNVSDTKKENKTEDKDIEILTQSYVPTINKRPNKVVMRKNSEKVFSTEKPISIETFAQSTTDNVSTESLTELGSAISSTATWNSTTDDLKTSSIVVS